MPSYQWDDTIIPTDGVEESRGYGPLPAGIYGAEIIAFKEGRNFDDTCNQAELSIKVISTKGTRTLPDWINLTDNLLWKIFHLFTSAKMRKHGETFQMNWKGLVGKTVFVVLKQEQYTTKAGVQDTRNKIYTYVPPEEVPVEVFNDYQQASGTAPVPDQDLPF